MAEAFGFSEDGARRIVAATRRLEGMPAGSGIGDPAISYGRRTFMFARNSGIVQFGNSSSNWSVYGGSTIGSETVTTTTGITAYLRCGIVLPSVTYILMEINGNLEVMNPDLEFVGKTSAAAINKGASGAIEVFTGTVGSETGSGTSVSSVYNRFANVAQTKWVRVGFCHFGSTFGWELVAAEC